MNDLEFLQKVGRPKKKAGHPRKPDSSPRTLKLNKINEELDAILREEVRRELDGLYAFREMPEASPFFESRAQFRIIRGGNQSSKTLNCAIAFAAWARNLKIGAKWAPIPKKRKGPIQLLAIGISQDHISKVMYQKLCLPGSYFKYRFQCPGCGERLFIFPKRKKTVLLEGEIGGNFPGYEGELSCTKCDWSCTLDEAERDWRWEAPPLIPAAAIKNVSWQNKGLEIPGIVETATAHIHFRTAGSGRQNFQGFQPDGVWIDEELGSEADGVWEEVSRGLMAKKSPLLWSATPLAKQEALIDMHDRAGEDKDVHETILGLAANFHLPKNAREATIRNWPDWQRPCRVSGEFLTLEGLVYGEFTQDQHVISMDEVNPREDSWKDQFCFYRSIDPGLNVSAVLFFAVDRNEDYLVFDEIYLRGGNIEQLAHAIIEKSKGLSFVDTVIDPSDQRSLTCREGLKVVLHRDYGIPTHSRFNRDVMQGIMRVKEDLIVRPEGRARMQVSDACTNLIREMRRYRRGDRKASTDMSGKVVKRDDHAVDSLRYRVMSGLRYVAPYEMPVNPGSHAYQQWLKEEAKRFRAQFAKRRML